MPRLKLGEILIKHGLISEAQLKQAMETQQKEKGRIGEILIKMGAVSEEDMTATLGEQLGLPYYSYTATEKAELLKPASNQNLEKIVPVDFAKKNNVLPLSKNINNLICAVADPLDLLLQDNLRRIVGCDIQLVIATETNIQKAITDFYFSDKHRDDGKKSSMLNQAVESTYAPQKFEASDTAAAPRESENVSDKSDLSLDKLIEKAGEAPVIKLVDLIIRQAIDERASDIHIEPFDNKIILRYRIDGNLYTIPPPAPHLHLAIVSRIKILAKLDIAEKRLPQDGAISVKLEDRVVDIRISTVPTVWGEKVVMRLLDKGAVKLELFGLGFDQTQIDCLKKALARPYGLFFVTGPTGSGKSTTLYSCLNETIDPRVNVVTVEDPVEYKIEGINQVAVKPEIGLTFATALKAFLRQDPDIIMVGEVRDLETASICVRAALTGHFVLSTLHTNDAASAITRLIDIGIPSYLLTPSLVLILAQRLARRLCPKCKEAYEPDPAQHGGIKFKSDLIYRAKGCEACNNSGYKGRIVVAETLLVDDEMKKIISKGATDQEIKTAARKNGMTTIFDSGIRLVEQGFTSFEEVARVSVDQ
ncbi:MAG TPA: ATPase, T2SS/T4P/T4SS family [Candidatus Omnitrophota bacterium]|nr:ATPase, T2SS/T4P/T4SS family [Candidatus Omnitrophota bacterium]